MFYTILSNERKEFFSNKLLESLQNGLVKIKFNYKMRKAQLNCTLSFNDIRKYNVRNPIFVPNVLSETGIIVFRTFSNNMGEYIKINFDDILSINDIHILDFALHNKK